MSGILRPKTSKCDKQKTYRERVEELKNGINKGLIKREPDVGEEGHDPSGRENQQEYGCPTTKRFIILHQIFFPGIKKGKIWQRGHHPLSHLVTLKDIEK